MPKKKLLADLTSLQRQLAEIDHPQPEVRQRLAALQQEIERIEARHVLPMGADSSVSGSGDDEEDDGFLDRLEEYAAEFEAEHPMLSATARDLIRRLASIGI